MEVLDFLVFSSIFNQAFPAKTAYVEIPIQSPVEYLQIQVKDLSFNGLYALPGGGRADYVWLNSGGECLIKSMRLHCNENRLFTVYPVNLASLRYYPGKLMLDFGLTIQGAMGNS